MISLEDNEAHRETTVLLMYASSRLIGLRYQLYEASIDIETIESREARGWFSKRGTAKLVRARKTVANAPASIKRLELECEELEIRLGTLENKPAPDPLGT